MENVAQLRSPRFEPRVYGVGAWTRHLHFAYDLVAALRPGVLLELGTDRGESYFAFCQSAAENETRTRCFAVDTWRGDAQAGGYDETTFREVSEHNAAHYAAFSTLIRANFDAALTRFADESIDVLHLDGLHTESAVRHDLEFWLPKLRTGGILMLHDVDVRQRDFGVWKLWDELRGAGRSFTFHEGPGLGVWQKSIARQLPFPLEDLLGAAPERTEKITEFYRDRANELLQSMEQQWRDGSIVTSTFARQTIIQVFHSTNGQHSEENSVFARIGHGEWKDVSILLPDDAGAAPLRIDFVTAFTVIEISSIRLVCAQQPVFVAARESSFAQVAVKGDAKRLVNDEYLRIEVNGSDPQLYLPPHPISGSLCRYCLEMRIRVSARIPTADRAGLKENAACRVEGRV